ncbi:hypothetical protein LSG25_18995 [Paralcaligenes sp. KSB-10]|uniref:hypothetical protein n=1 Tax=Paralcaligenes sp. KSB-10 TaxID=2901142 RepID=UPI001E5E8346|nr:hypothetical protein [Paralcaligenes sp. KSB-10]UHL64080.1 hypothetical protein LSG25_18995 [Paralcaligenes sp. KSB-10]
MRFRNLSKWNDSAHTAGLLFFAQLLEELLFDFSLDTYKASVMQTGSLCSEAIRTIDDIEAGNIKEPNIWHVTSELCASFEKDSVAQALVPLPSGAFFGKLKNTRTPLKELKDVLKLLLVQLKPTSYRDKNEELLANEICGRQAHSEIRRLARSYITTLVSTGYSQKYLHETSLDFFWRGPGNIIDNAAIMEFFALIPRAHSSFTAIFHVDKLFAGAATAFDSLGMKIHETLPDNFETSKWPAFTSQAHGRIYAVVEKISARDVYSARMEAESRLKMGSTFLSLFHHKKEACWSPDSIIINEENSQQRKISQPINSMHKCLDMREVLAAKQLQLFMQDFSLERQSFAKFISSSRLHSMALASDTEENQILNLWVALESLVPSETKSADTSNIEHITNSITPFLNFEYIERLLDNLVRDLLRWNHRATKTALRNVPGKKFTHKLAKLLALQQFSAELAQLENSFRDFHLLRDRVGYFKSTLSSPEAVIDALKNHKQRLDWQIRRIYRTRNVIVHTGVTPDYTRTLIEHTHVYLDSILATLIKLASKPRVINSVGQGFKFIELKYASYCAQLSDKNLEFDITNIERLLFDQ